MSDIFDYLPVSPNIIKTGTTIGCNLYLRTKSIDNDRFVLYCREDADFEVDKKEMLVKKKVRCLYIKKDEQKNFYEYMENNFNEIIDIPDIVIDGSCCEHI